MRDVDDSTLWEVSTFDEVRTRTGSSGFAALDGVSELSSLLRSDLALLRDPADPHALLQAVAACVRRRERALVLLRHAELVWPLTLFPLEGLYHCAADLEGALQQGTRGLRLLSVEPPTITPPAARMAARAPHFHLLGPLLWVLALNAPAPELLPEIGGRAAYRISALAPGDEPPVHGATAMALKRLRSEIAALHDIEQWPGMNRARAAALLNGAYLQGALMVLRTHAAAKDPQAKGLWGRVSGRG